MRGGRPPHVITVASQARDDGDLMAAFQRGDEAAFAELVERHEARLWTFLRRFVGDAATAEDLLQETFLRVVHHAPSWRPEARVTTWMFTIARNLCTDHARRREHRDALSLDAPVSARSEDSAPRLLDRLPGASRADGPAHDHEIASRVDRAIAALPKEQREVFLMREVMELPFADIAAAVGISLPTVKSRMRYALERLREALAELRDTGEREAAGRVEAEA